ncbi:flagellar biosynthetic protein FliO [Rhizobium sp. L1K21]|uniref:flagellar biosynthetic protein FliO n=1 Tax=Rhizobium sp. L1K21 TaxID=2954933 RepID=UPI0020925F83|nr:flagellar biosynthetic protein FliO [Rhizobium sp. L1K21]MCO6186350.1 flagellar biosynthetic protein FliO [Rhizobium sp. L1K21]
MDIDFAGQLLPAFVGVGVALGAFAMILWIIKNRKSRFFALPGTGSQRRLAVVESVALDVRRRLILVRRDNVEHLIMIGGPADLVVETKDHGAVAETQPRTQSAAPVQPKMPEQPRQQPRRPAQQQMRQETHAPRQQTRQPFEDDDYAYGPEAAALSRDYQTEEAFEPSRAGQVRNPQQSFARSEPAEDELEARLKQEAAEAILEAARKRLLGEDAVQPTTTPPPQPRPHQSRAPTTAANMRESAFSRVLDGRPQAGDIPASQTPQVQPAKTWSPPITERSQPPAQAATAAAVAKRMPQQHSDEDDLEDRVRLILDELQRKQK